MYWYEAASSLVSRLMSLILPFHDFEASGPDLAANARSSRTTSPMLAQLIGAKVGPKRLVKKVESEAFAKRLIAASLACVAYSGERRNGWSETIAGESAPDAEIVFTASCHRAFRASSRLLRSDLRNCQLCANSVAASVMIATNGAKAAT